MRILLIMIKKNNNQEIIFPPINIGYFNNSIKNKNKEVNNNNKYRVRIRLNRIKKLAVDRYIQKNDSMDPFDDAFNEKIMKYQKYEPSLALNSINYNSFEKLLKEYYEQKYKFLSFISDSDEEYDSILKTKKSNKRMMNKKGLIINNLFKYFYYIFIICLCYLKILLILI